MVIAIVKCYVTDEETDRILRKLKKECRKSASEIIREAIQEYSKKRGLTNENE